MYEIKIKANMLIDKSAFPIDRSAFPIDGWKNPNKKSCH
jgi:hypothetical protein